MPADHTFEREAERFARRFASMPLPVGAAGASSAAALPARMRSRMEGALVRLLPYVEQNAQYQLFIFDVAAPAGPYNASNPATQGFNYYNI